MHTLGIWALVIVVALFGAGLLVELNDLITTLRLMDVACHD